MRGKGGVWLRRRTIEQGSRFASMDPRTGEVVSYHPVDDEAAARTAVVRAAVNGVIAFAAVPALPFGGVGDSGFGRIHGADGLREFARTKAVTRRLFPAAVPVLTFTRPVWAMRVLLRIVRIRYGR